MPQTRLLDSLRRTCDLTAETFEKQAGELTRLSGAIVEAFHRDGRLFVAGSGNLTQIAALVEAYFVDRLTSFERPPLPAVALGQNLPLGTALDQHGRSAERLARPFSMLARSGDLLLMFADGSHDPALEALGQAAADLGCPTTLVRPERLDWTGPPVEFCFQLPTDHDGEQVELSLLFGRLLCELVERGLFQAV
ncbi:MAG: SIS domain-containing protein [Deltaproteobacteria bacterium]|nr:MAG: SIS domain-containing protein [Deltaproteobacteria bacterium]